MNKIISGFSFENKSAPGHNKVPFRRRNKAQFAQKGFLLSVVVPCYNEEAVIQITHERLTRILGKLSHFKLELIYVNDGSIDNTEDILYSIAEQDQRAQIISLARNFGQQAALTAGLEFAGGDLVAIIDADLQDPPEIILEMIEKWQEGFDVVYGIRAKRKESLIKRAAYSSFYRIYKFLTRIDVPVDSGDFSLLDRCVVNVLKSLPEKNRFLRGLRTWVGFRQTGVVYERPARAAGKSKYDLHGLMQLAFDGIFSFSTVPLTLILVIGLLLLLGVGLACLLVWTISGTPIFGQSYDMSGCTAVVLILLGNAIQLLAVGILGVYLGRLFLESKMRPIYVVKDVYRRDTEALATQNHTAKQQDVESRNCYSDIVVSPKKEKLICDKTLKILPK